MSVTAEPTIIHCRNFADIVCIATCGVCSLIVGDNMNVKGALGMPNVALYADAAPGYDSAWCSNADQWPKASSTTGDAPSCLLMSMRC